jgi:hypothetical protein
MSPSKSLEGWKPPEGLGQSWPRRTALGRAGIALCVVSALMLVGGVVLALATAREGWRRQAEVRQMRAEGRETKGVVTLMLHGGEHDNDFRLEYRFTVDGRVYGGGADVGKRQWQSLGVGMPVAIRYLPSAPAHNYPSADPPGTTGIWLACLAGGIVAAIGAWLPLKIRRQRHLLEGGRPAPAVVTRVKESEGWPEQGWRCTVYYQFSLPDGATCQGRSSLRARYIPEGSVICILYDPDNPQRSDCYPLSLVKPAAD